MGHIIRIVLSLRKVSGIPPFVLAQIGIPPDPFRIALSSYLAVFRAHDGVAFKCYVLIFARAVVYWACCGTILMRRSSMGKGALVSPHLAAHVAFSGPDGRPINPIGFIGNP